MSAIDKYLNMILVEGYSPSDVANLILEGTDPEEFSFEGEVEDRTNHPAEGGVEDVPYESIASIDVLKEDGVWMVRTFDAEGNSTGETVHGAGPAGWAAAYKDCMSRGAANVRLPGADEM